MFYPQFYSWSKSVLRRIEYLAEAFLKQSPNRSVFFDLRPYDLIFDIKRALCRSQRALVNDLILFHYFAGMLPSDVFALRPVL